MLGVPDQRPAADAVERQQVEREGVFPDVDVGRLFRAADHHPHDLLAGGIAQGVGDAVAAVSPFAAQRQPIAGLVELRAPVDQFADALRPFANDPLDHRGIAQRAAGFERVGHMVLETVVRIEHAGDAPLGLVAVRLLRGLFGGDDDRQFRIDPQRRPQPGQPAADDQHVGEEMRHVLGMERNEVSRDRGGHGSFTVQLVEARCAGVIAKNAANKFAG